MAQVRGRATHLPISQGKVQQAFDLLSNTVWSVSKADFQKLCRVVFAADLEFSIHAVDGVALLWVKMWSDDAVKVKDAVADATDGFWLKFRQGLDACMDVPLKEQPCIL